MTRGLRIFLDGLGAMSARERATAARTAAKAWATELAHGEVVDLSGLVIGLPVGPRVPDVVWIDDIELASICPHHLLPMRGMASVAYSPNALIAPLGHVARLVQAAAARLVLQEDLAEEIADRLADALDPRGVACLIVGSHDCMQLRGRRTRSARVRVLATRGTMAKGGARAGLLAHWREAR